MKVTWKFLMGTGKDCFGHLDSKCGCTVTKTVHVWCFVYRKPDVLGVIEEIPHIVYSMLTYFLLLDTTTVFLLLFLRPYTELMIWLMVSVDILSSLASLSCKIWNQSLWKPVISYSFFLYNILWMLKCSFLCKVCRAQYKARW